MEAPEPSSPESTALLARGRGTSLNPGNRFESIRLEVLQEALADAHGEHPCGVQVRTRVYRDRTRQIINRVDSPDLPFRWTINPYRGCEQACVYCADGETRILMADGTTRALGEMHVGDEIYGTERRGSCRRFVRTKVLAHWETRKPAYRVTLEDGTTLIASADHRFLTLRGWKFLLGAGRGAGCRPHLTTNDELWGFGAFAHAPIEGHDYKRGYLTGGLAAALKTRAKLRVVSIEPYRSRMELYDITTGTGDFVANGVISHNCYARPTHETLGFSCGLDFETKIVAKPDAPQLLRRELAAPGWHAEPIVMSGVTDCYQPLEAKLEITRGCLEVMAECRQPVSIVTKNRLVVRDLELLKSLAAHRAVSVALSVTTLDQKLAALMEPRASRPKDRLRAVSELADAGIPVSVLIAPIIPGLNDHEIPHLLRAAAEAGAGAARWVMLRLPHQVKTIFLDWLAVNFPDRAAKIEGFLRAIHAGRLYDPAWGSRMRGQGTIAAHIAETFRVFAARHGLDGAMPSPSSAAFRPPRLHDDGQLSLFGEADAA